MTMIIKKLENKRKFMYLWGKYVEGVCLDFHCAKSLVGKYSKKINKDITILENIELNESDSKIFYLCGVTEPYVWEGNFHLAIKHKEGSTLKIKRKGLYLEIENAEELPIKFNIEECNHKNKYKKEYSTCRNWQFAYLYKDLIEKG